MDAYSTVQDPEAYHEALMKDFEFYMRALCRRLFPRAISDHRGLMRTVRRRAQEYQIHLFTVDKEELEQRFCLYSGSGGRRASVASRGRKSTALHRTIGG